MDLRARHRAPSTVIVLDTEARRHHHNQGETQSLRCWAARGVTRWGEHGVGQKWTEDGTEADQLAATVAAWARKARHAWLYMHNTSYDLSLTGLLPRLFALGWHATDWFWIDTGAPGLILENRPRSLHVVDSVGLTGESIERLGEALGFPKLAIPADDAPDQDWRAYCGRDADILMAHLLQVMGWWDGAGLGGWKPSGASLGWAMFTRRHGGGGLEFTQDDRAIGIERQAIHGGLKWVPKVGGPWHSRYAEMDIHGAYPSAAAYLPCPAERLGPMTGDDWQEYLAGGSDLGIIAKVSITAEAPRWPARLDGHVVYPVGTFVTTLAGPEITDAHQRATVRRAGPGLAYKLGAPMAEWACDVLGMISGHDPDLPPTVAMMGKSWSRTVIGKTCQRGRRVTPWQGPPCPGLALEQVIDYQTGDQATAVGLDDRWWLVHTDIPGRHELPAIFAWIESEIRRRLWAMIEQVPEAATIRAHTDGMIADLAALDQWAAQLSPGRPGAAMARKGAAAPADLLSGIVAPMTIRRKHTYQVITALGPERLILDGREKMSGLGKTRWRDSNGQLWGEDFAGLFANAATHPNGGVDIRHVTFNPDLPDVDGWILADGTVRPYQLRITRKGDNELVPWPETRWAAQGDQLAEVQSIATMALTDPGRPRA